jgi:crotonobetaine/carnitine-CoA ligase
VLTHPLVKDVAAIAVTNPDVHEAAGDEEVKVCVVLEPDAVLDPADLVDYLEARMPAYWLPRFVEYVDELPRTESHKLKKAELRAAGVTTGTWDRTKTPKPEAVS